MSELEDMLSGLLSSPDAMEKLTQAASQLGLGAGEQEKPAVSSLLPLLGGKRDDRYSRLISALRPFLSEKRRERLDEAERMISMFGTVEAVRSAFGANGGEENKQ